MLALLLSLAGSLCISPSHAEMMPIHAESYQGTIDFTPAEVKAHQAGLMKLIDTTLKATAAKKAEQNAWFKKCGMGTMYGWLAPYSKLTPAQRQIWIDKHAQCSARPTVADITVTSCENFTNKMISKGFDSIGTSATYKKINMFLNANDRDGLALVLALQKLGWKTVYWNTDTGSVPPLPQNRAYVGATPADHVYDQKIALTKHTYHGIALDGYLVNFSPNPGSPTPIDDHALKMLKTAPYFVGISHAGFHVWNGSFGEITESHSFFDPDSRTNIQSGEFYPPHVSPTCRVINGVCYGYFSGILAVPPGPWLWF